MKLLLASLLATVTSFPIYAQTDSGSGSTAISQLASIVSSADENTSQEQLNSDLLAAIKAICEDCTATQVDAMITEVVNAVGADSPLISTFLTSLSNAGVDADIITLSAITAGVDATVASNATAAGPVQGNNSPTNQQQAPDVIFTAPATTPTPQGAGGNGGDAGISEVGG